MMIDAPSYEMPKSDDGKKEIKLEKGNQKEVFNYIQQLNSKIKNE
ncbi:hypothetical protein [Aquirufa ecclesiirivi]